MDKKKQEKDVEKVILYESRKRKGELWKKNLI